MSFIKEYRDLAEFIYFLTGPLMLGGIIVAIFQLRLLKKEIADRVLRESINLALSTMEREISEFEKLVNKAFHFGEDLKFPEFKGEIKGFNKSELKCTNNWLEAFNECMSENCERDALEFICLIEDAINKLEGICQYILSGVVDENYCYNIEGDSLVHDIEQLKPFIVCMKHGGHPRTYENIIKLYDSWTVKLEHEITISKKYEIDKRLESLPTPKSVRVIGR